MAKLYWRYKKDGKWTWRAAIDVGKDEDGFISVIDYDDIHVPIPKEEEEWSTLFVDIVENTTWYPSV